jgi:zinc protease
MNYHITQHETYSLGVVPTTDLGIVIASITIDLHTDNSVREQVVQLLYPDALLSGAGKLSREAFLNAINLLGAEIATTIGEGRLTITIRSNASSFPKVLSLAKVMLVEPTFATSEIKRIKTTVTNELHVKQEQTAVIAREQLRNSFYSQNDRRYTTDTPSLLKEMPTINPKILHLYHKNLFSKKWTCTIASDAKGVQSFERLLKEVRKDNKIMSKATTHKQLTIHRSLTLKDVPSRSNIDFSIGIPTPLTIHHDDFVPLSFALGVLGIPGFAGRLMSTVREQEGLTYGIYAYPESFSGTEQGYARIMTFFTPEKSLQGLTSTFREIKKFYQRGITEAEFETFKNIFKTKQTLLQDSPFKQLNDLHSFNQNGFSVEEIKHFKNKLNSITREQVNEVIKKYFDPSQFSISGAGPTKAVEKEISSFFTTLK